MTTGGLNPEEDRQLMLRMAQGDAQAFERLYHAHFPNVRAFVARVDRIGTDDLTQEVFVRAWQYRQRFRGDSSAKTYLIGIARNVLRERKRSNRNQRWQVNADLDQLPAPAADDSPTDSDSALLTVLEHAKASLPANQLQAIELVYYLRLKPAQAADIAGCSCKAMRRRLEQARSRLRRLLEHLLKT